MTPARLFQEAGEILQSIAERSEPIGWASHWSAELVKVFPAEFIAA
jgi:hypothetical protein